MCQITMYTFGFFVDSKVMTKEKAKLNRPCLCFPRPFHKQLGLGRGNSEIPKTFDYNVKIKKLYIQSHIET